MSRCSVRICRNIIIRVAQHFRPKPYQISSSQTHPQCSSQILCIKVRIKIDLIDLPLDSLRIGRSVLMQSCLMHQTQSCQQKRKQIMETKKTVQCRIIYTKPSPKPSNNRSSHNRQCTCLTCNNSPSPQTHLSPRKNIPNKSSQNHDQQKNDTNQPNQLTWLCITSVILSTKQMHINYNKEETPSICMQITQQPSIWNIAHQMLNTMKSHVNMCGIMHCQKNSGPNLQDQTKSSLHSPIIISILIRRCGITDLMVLNNTLLGLFLQTSTIFFESFHRKKRRKNEFPVSRFSGI